MLRLSDDTIARLKEAHPLDGLIGERTRLGPANAKGVRAGPCLCEPVRGKAPLWVNCDANTFGCLKPNGCGGDVFDFLERFDGLNFAGAVARLGGADVASDPAAEAEMRERRARLKAERAARAAALDREHRDKALAIWRAGVSSAGTLADAYFRHRGLEPIVAPALRFSADEPFYAAPETEGGRPTIVHRGPCLLAAIQAPDGLFHGLHRTWIDPRLADGPLDRDASGKARITLPDGTPLLPKKMRGGKKGGAIRLNDFREDGLGERAGERVLVIGEGIETTATGLQALDVYGRAAVRYFGWAAGDLGNISGGTLGPATPHPTKPGHWVPSSDPDMGDPGLLPPAWADRVILLGDGDSDAATTRARLTCAQRRYEHLGTPTTIRMAPPTKDFNDLARAG